MKTRTWKVTLKRFVLAGVLAFAAWISTAQADTVNTNLSPTSPPYFSDSSFAIEGSKLPFGLSIAAMGFTPTGTFNLSEVDVALSYLTGTNGAVVTLNADSSDTPGSVLQTWDVSNLPFFGTDRNTLEMLSGNPSITLSSGVQYWVEVAPSDAYSESSWYPNNTGATGPYFYDVPLVAPPHTVNDQGLAAFDVLGTPVGSVAAPEPSSVALLALGLAGLGLLVFVRRRGEKVQT